MRITYKRGRTREVVVHTEECRQYLDIWLRQIDKSPADPASMQAAVEHVASCTWCQKRIHQLMQAVAGSAEDPLTCDECQAWLPEYVEAQAAGSIAGRFANVRRHLALCPHCAEVYTQVSELVQESHADAVPVAESYPDFDLSMIQEMTWPKGLVQDALEQGRRRVHDTAGALYLLLGPDVTAQQTVAWATKSAQAGTLLHQITLSDAPATDWEVEVLVFADDDDFCRIEVALYHAGATDTELADIPITLRYHETLETQITDAGGVVEFAGIPISTLDEMVIRVAPRE